MARRKCPPSSYGSRSAARRNSLTIEDFAQSNEEDDPFEETDRSTTHHSKLLDGLKSKLDKTRHDKPKTVFTAKRKNPSDILESRKKKFAKGDIDYLAVATTYTSSNNRANSNSVASSSVPSSIGSGSKPLSDQILSIQVNKRAVKSPPVPRKGGTSDPIINSSNGGDSDMDSVKSVHKPTKTSKVSKKEDRKPKSATLDCYESDTDVQDVTLQKQEDWRETVDSSWQPSPNVPSTQALMDGFDRFNENPPRKAVDSKKESNKVINVDDDTPQDNKLHLTRSKRSKAQHNRLDPMSSGGGILATVTSSAVAKSSYGKPSTKRTNRKRKTAAKKIPGPSPSRFFGNSFGGFLPPNDKQNPNDIGSQQPAPLGLESTKNGAERRQHDAGAQKALQQTAELELESTKNGTERRQHYAGAQKALAQSPTEDPAKKRIAARMAKKKKKREEIISICDDDDDDDHKHEETTYLCVDAKRIAIGKKVVHSGCQFKVLEGMVHVTFQPEASQPKEAIYPISQEDFTMIRVYNSGDRGLIFLQAKRTDANKLPSKKIYDPKTQFIVIEFPGDIKNLIETMRGLFPYFLDSNEVDSDEELNKMCEALIDHDERQDTNTKTRSRRKRNKEKQTNRPAFLAGKSNDDILVDFPFGTSEIYNAARDLPVLSCVLDEKVDSDTEEATDCESGVHVLLRVADFDCLDPGVFLNDNMIDFFCQW